MNPSIKELQETKLIGQKAEMTFGNNQSLGLWKEFMRRRAEIKNAADSNVYAVDVYEGTRFFQNFDPPARFEKWAAIKVDSFDSIPQGMERLILPGGTYAVFEYKGKASEIDKTYQYIFGIWLPNSNYELDDRPHFALMGEKYKGEDSSSEEELWVPVVGN